MNSGAVPLIHTVCPDNKFRYLGVRAGVKLTNNKLCHRIIIYNKEIPHASLFPHSIRHDYLTYLSALSSLSVLSALLALSHCIIYTVCIIYTICTFCIKKNEMGWACGAYGGGERYAQGFRGEA
jgi:sorbitol-specific phosphotransferase system component IIC